MSLTERDRHDAYEALHETFGAKTDIVIAMLRPSTDLVTKDDLAVTTSALRAEMADLRSEMSQMRADVTTEISAAIQTQTRSLMFMMMGAVLLLILTDALQGFLS